jgi:hypothetical protein
MIPRRRRRAFRSLRATRPENAPKATDSRKPSPTIACGAMTPTGLYALARFLDYQCDEDASFAQTNACVALCAITGAVTAAHGMDAIKHAAHLPFGGFKESEVAAFLRRGGIDGARQRTLAGVAFRRRARDTPRLRPTRAGRIIPRRGVSLEEGP